MSPRPTKAQAQPALADAILDVTWAQILAGGTDAINLRAIGRTLGITAPAIYHYYPDRAALVQALRYRHLNQGATQLAHEWQRQGVDQAYTGMHAVCYAYRTWAIADPLAYLMAFGHDTGNPTPPAWMMQLLMPFVQAVDVLQQQNQVRVRTQLTLTPQGQTAFDAWRAVVGDVDATAVATAVIIWSRLHGLMVAELGRVIPEFGVDGASMFRFEVNALMRELFYPPQIHTTQTA